MEISGNVRLAHCLFDLRGQGNKMMLVYAEQIMQEVYAFGDDQHERGLRDGRKEIAKTLYQVAIDNARRSDPESDARAAFFVMADYIQKLMDWPVDYGQLPYRLDLPAPGKGGGNE